MVYPIDKIDEFKIRRKILAGSSFSFSIGAFFNLLPFLDLTNLNNLQLAFLVIDAVALVISALVFLVYSKKIENIRNEVISNNNGGNRHRSP